MRRHAFLAALSFAIGTVVALAGGELFVRVFIPTYRHERLELTDKASRMEINCYTDAPGAHLPLDLRREEDVRAVSRAVGFVSTSARELVLTDPTLDFLRIGQPFGSAAPVLAREVPLCVTYDNNPLGGRFWVSPRGATRTIALLGDSFTWGQGVAQHEALPQRLAALAGLRVRSYAFPGSNIPELTIQFRELQRDRLEYGFSDVIYVYVLNDPLPSPELVQRFELLNDLMNVRFGFSKPHQNFWVRLASKAAPYSQLARMVLFRTLSLTLSRQTLDWYRDLNDPRKNSGFSESMNVIARMSADAKAKGMRFRVVIYPLMLDFERYPLEDVHQLVAREMQSRGVEVEDLLPAFRRKAKGRNLTVHPLDYHPNGEAHAIVAGELARLLRAP